MIYIILYITYAPRAPRNSTLKVFVSMNMGLFTLILLVTHFAVKEKFRVEFLGWVCVAISVSVFAAPLSIVAQVIRTRSVEFMPFNLSFFLTLSAVMWFAYGLFLKDICIAIPNVVGFVLGLLQMLLYAIYRNNKKVIDENKLPDQQLKNVVIISTLGTVEVFPVDTQSYANGESVNNDAKEHEQLEELKKSMETQNPIFRSFVLRLLQMLLFSIYKNNKKVIKENKLPIQQLKNIAVISTLGTAEAFPVDAQSYANGQSMNIDAKE
ncbi:hypothetical protein SO802_012220 [Lithocarpus litseifolius]|uniref:Bidirectional sugar transporter SWEET n=1 Tax=Lithocarpus litseifolius TaxID=425828 RepID=A0AAW2D4T0_9ROSI